MIMTQQDSLESLFFVAKDLAEKQAVLQSMITNSPDPKLLLKLSKSVREISRINRKIAEITRQKGQERRQGLLLVQVTKSMAA